jgi:hypothetical protein
VILRNKGRPCFSTQTAAAFEAVELEIALLHVVDRE